MRIQHLMGVLGIFMIGTVLACVCSGRWLLDGETNIINALASFDTVTIASGGGVGFAKQVPPFFNAILTALTWSYPFLESPWCIFVKIPLWQLSIGVVWGLIELAINAIQGILSAVRSLI